MIIDAVDTVSAKIELVLKAQEHNIPIISSMGAVNKVRPIDDLSISCRTHCICPPGTKRKCTIRRDIPGSNAFVPSTVGLIIASEVVKDLTTI